MTLRRPPRRLPQLSPGKNPVTSDIVAPLKPRQSELSALRLSRSGVALAAASCRSANARWKEPVQLSSGARVRVDGAAPGPGTRAALTILVAGPRQTVRVLELETGRHRARGARALYPQNDRLEAQAAHDVEWVAALHDT